MRPRAFAAVSFYEERTDEGQEACGTARTLHASVVVPSIELRVLAAIVNAFLFGMSLCVENHCDQRLARLRAARGALARFGRFDHEHALAAAVDPSELARELGGFLGRVHVKGASRPTLRKRLVSLRARRRICGHRQSGWLDTGDVVLLRLAASLDALGYGGALSVEYEGDDARGSVTTLLDRMPAASFSQSRDGD